MILGVGSVTIAHRNAPPFSPTVCATRLKPSRASPIKTDRVRLCATVFPAGSQLLQLRASQRWQHISLLLGALICLAMRVCFHGYCRYLTFILEKHVCSPKTKPLRGTPCRLQTLLGYEAEMSANLCPAHLGTYYWDVKSQKWQWMLLDYWLIGCS